MEIGELRDFHPIEPDLPAEPPRAERRVLPVVVDETEVMLGRIKSDGLEGVEIEVDDSVWRGFEDDLILKIVLQAVWIGSISAVFRPSAGFDIRR